MLIVESYVKLITYNLMQILERVWELASNVSWNRRNALGCQMMILCSLYNFYKKNHKRLTDIPKIARINKFVKISNWKNSRRN